MARCCSQVPNCVGGAGARMRRRAAGELVDHAAFAGLPPSRRIIVPDAEAYAANCVSIRGRVLLPAGFPATRRLVAERGWPVEEVDLSEFRKVDGGASCLSLRF
mmetsp:Transcript_11426/g.31875  ORF Transcript_11426/g.31875 Transcript_11426/m.31875 type:complete len:104 (-) Transcript_11426:6-317(-)